MSGWSGGSELLLPSDHALVLKTPTLDGLSSYTLDIELAPIDMRDLAALDELIELPLWEFDGSLGTRIFLLFPAAHILLHLQDQHF